MDHSRSKSPKRSGGGRSKSPKGPPTSNSNTSKSTSKSNKLEDTIRSPSGGYNHQTKAMTRKLGIAVATTSTTTSGDGVTTTTTSTTAAAATSATTTFQHDTFHSDTNDSISSNNKMKPMGMMMTSGSANRRKSPLDASIRSEDRNSVVTIHDTILEVIPQEYLFHPTHAEPILHYLPKAVASSAVALSNSSSHHHHHPPTASSSTRESVTASSSAVKFPDLRVLMAAAEDDIRLHRARVQAGKANDTSLLRLYKIEQDPSWLARQQRLHERWLLLSKLDTERDMILQELRTDTMRGLTAVEKTHVQLARWQRALELFVYSPPPNMKKSSTMTMTMMMTTTTSTTSSTMNSSGTSATVTSTTISSGTSQSQEESKTSQSLTVKKEGGNLDLLGLLEKLFEGIAEVRCLEFCNSLSVCSYTRVWI